MINLKSKKKQNIVRVLFLLVLFFVGNYYLANPVNNKVNREINSYTLTNVDILGTSGHWNLAPFVIDDSGGGDYTWEEASAETWCSGSGTFEDPYLIENVTIDGGNLGNCITINNSDKYFRIENCTVYNSGSGSYDAGIRLDHAGNGTLTNNNCSLNNNAGIILYHSCFNNTISGNIANNNIIGIYIISDNNIVSGNTANNNIIGIYIISDNNTVSGNIAKNNNNYGIILYYSDNTTVSGNTANNNHHNGISLYGSYNTTVSGNTANNNKHNGIYLYDSNSTTVSGNTANNNGRYGIYSYRSNSTTVSGNVVDNNWIYGIYILESDYNLIYNNYFINNGIHALDEGNFNNWNSSIIGNYWDNYTGIDADKNGIGDTPHVFSGGIDYLPIYDQAPLITIYYPINGTYWSYRKNIKIEATDTNLDSIWYEVNGQRVFISSGVTVLFDNEIWVGLPEGAFIIEIYANDTFGHLNDTYSLLLYKDTTAPILTINSPIQDQGFIDAPTFSITITELNLNTMWYVIVSDGTTKHIITSTTGSIDVSAWNSLTDGTITIRFYANDTAGNEVYSEVSIVKDTSTAPTPGIPGFNVIIALSVIFLVSVVIITRKKKLLNLN